MPNSKNDLCRWEIGLNQKHKQQERRLCVDVIDSKLNKLKLWGLSVERKRADCPPATEFSALFVCPPAERAAPPESRTRNRMERAAAAADGRSAATVVREVGAFRLSNADPQCVVLAVGVRLTSEWEAVSWYQTITCVRANQPATGHQTHERLLASEAQTVLITW